MKFRVPAFALALLFVSSDARTTEILVEKGTHAVDANGVRRDGNAYPRHHPPWFDDLQKRVAPNYSIDDRARHHTGVGVFRLQLDLQGAVTSVSVLQSTGHTSLDRSAVAALRKWRWRPGRWKEIEMPVTFTMAGRG